jgi:Holliday junction resolvase RusA-like endonuclease
MHLPVEFEIPISPVPCPRPRVSRWGVYYPKKYVVWRKSMAAAVTEAKGRRHTISSSRRLVVELECYVKTPKNSKLEDPKPDVDNYAKAILDACNKILWDDDSQIVELKVTKQWSGSQHGGKTVIRVSSA